jgi:ABC-2 type transport system ATP-binding protein
LTGEVVGGDAAIEALGLVKRYGELEAVAGVDLRVDPGEVRGLLGPNGAGKTTLLRMLFGLVRPDSGEARVFGRPVRVGRGDVLQGVAGFTEAPRFYPYLSARRNLELLARLDGNVSRTQIAAKLDRVGLANSGDQKVGGFSTGMRLRLGLAAALLRAPKLLLLDEPTAGLDPGGTLELRDLVRGLVDGGATVLLSSHDMSEVEVLCDGVTIMRRGSAVWSGTLANLRAEAPAPTQRLHTTDDDRTLELAREMPGLRVAHGGRAGIEVTGCEREVDELVLALGRAGIAVRRLQPEHSPLEEMFLSLTEQPR